MKRNLFNRGSLLTLLAQFCAVILLLVLLFVLVGCTLPGWTVLPAESLPTTDVPAPATTAVPSTAEAPATAEVPVTEIPSETPTEAPTAPAEPQPIDPLSLLGEVDSVHATIADEYGWRGEYSYALPCLLTDTEGALAINKAILDRFGDSFQYAKETIAEGSSSGLGSMSYRGLVWEDVLTVIVNEHMYYDWTDYGVYCYEYTTGRWLTTPLLLEKMGISEEAFLETCREAFRDRFARTYPYVSQQYPEDSYFNELLEAQPSDRYVNLDLMTYPDYGDLVAVAPILSLAGPEFGYQEVHLGFGGPLSLLGEASFEEGTYTDDCGNVTDYSYAIPRILADTEGARAINAAIDDYFGGCVRDEKECMEEGCSIIVYSIDYVGHVWEDILTVEVPLKNDWGCDDWGIYCYSTATGEWLTTAMLLERMVISE